MGCHGDPAFPGVEDTSVCYSFAFSIFLSPVVCFVSISYSPKSLNDKDLKVLGRDHSSEHALRTISEARGLCPGRVSVDVMFGRPGQSVASWETELEGLLRVCDDHVSLYQLTLERGTQLFKQVEQGELTPPSEDITATMYRTARHILENQGLRQYEVSNFARNVSVFFVLFCVSCLYCLFMFVFINCFCRVLLVSIM